MKSNSLAILVTLWALLFLPPMLRAQFTYSVNYGTITITSYTGTNTAVTIPSVINGLTVTDIGTNVFDSDEVTSVIIPDTVTSIGAGAFANCTALTNVSLPLGLTEIESNAFVNCGFASITIPDGITNIGASAFWGCEGLTNVTLGSGLTNIGQFAFEYCRLTTINVAADNSVFSSVDGVLFNKTQTTLVLCPGGLKSYSIPAGVTGIGPNAFANPWLTNVIFPDSVTEIGASAFAGCQYLTKVALPAGLTDIESYAFSGCAFTSVIVPDTVTNIGTGAFLDCGYLKEISVPTGNPTYSSAGGILFDKTETTLLQFPDGLEGSYSVPPLVKRIGAEAFEDCGLTNVSLPLGLTDVEANAFTDAFLAKITIPASVTNLGQMPFYQCGNLTAITVDSNNSAYSSVDGVLFNKSGTVLIEAPGRLEGSYSIPSGVIDIESNAFNECYDLTNLTIPNSVANIGDYAFWDCWYLRSVSLGDGIANIGAFAFSGLDYDGPALYLSTFGCPITSIVLPPSLTSIGEEAFAGCRLTNVTIGSGVTNIGQSAFGYCQWLPAINVAANNSAFSSAGGVLFNKSQTKLLEYPAGLYGSYEIPMGVMDIASNAFYACGVTSVTFPSSVTNIGDYAFWNCSGLTNISLGDGVVSIGEYAFSGEGIYFFEHPEVHGCQLTSIIFPSSVTNIGEGAFAACFGLTNVYFQGNAPGIDSSAFSGESDRVTAYYLPGTTGWTQFATNAGIAVAPWLPEAQATGLTYGAGTNQFGFNSFWVPGNSVVIEACENLSNPVWTAVATNNAANGTSTFTDPAWTNYPSRFYRLRAQ
jgi:hypothetical protein